VQCSILSVGCAVVSTPECGVLRCVYNQQGAWREIVQSN
jgi:hypothetical protein